CGPAGPCAPALPLHAAIEKRNTVASKIRMFVILSLADDAAEGDRSRRRRRADHAGRVRYELIRAPHERRIDVGLREIELLLPVGSILVADFRTKTIVDATDVVVAGRPGAVLAGNPQVRAVVLSRRRLPQEYCASWCTIQV